MQILRTSHNLYNIYESHPQSLDHYVHLSEKIQKTEEKFNPKLLLEQFFNKINSQISKNRENGENKEKLRALFSVKKPRNTLGGTGAGDRGGGRKKAAGKEAES